jgi:hypothetical protein
MAKYPLRTRYVNTDDYDAGEPSARHVPQEKYDDSAWVWLFSFRCTLNSERFIIIKASNEWSGYELIVYYSTKLSIIVKNYN